MRLFMNALLLGATLSLFGCASKAPDPYAGMRMLAPEELTGVKGHQDPVEQAEKAHNAQFIHNN